MRLLVRHGINGKEELAIQVAGTALVGWDIMTELAWRLNLESPFQIILYLNSTAAMLSPVRAISSHMTSTDLEISRTKPAGPNSRALSIGSDSII